MILQMVLPKQCRKANSRAWDGLYSADASYQMRELQGTHPVRKVLHMQKCYPETVLRLNRGNDRSSSIAASTPIDRPISSRWIRNPSPNNRNTSPSSVQYCRGTKDVERGVSDSTRRRIADEYQFCHGKMAYNRTKGRYGQILGPCVPLFLILNNVCLFSSFHHFFRAHAQGRRVEYQLFMLPLWNRYPRLFPARSLRLHNLSLLFGVSAEHGAIFLTKSLCSKQGG